MNITRTLSAVLLTTLLAACGGATPPGPVTSPPSPTTPGQPAPVPPGTPAPEDPVQAYTMQGVVVNAQGEPLAGVEVWADNTLYYNMNALGVTDSKGHYRIELPREQLGTWRAGGRFLRTYHGETYDLGLVVDDEAPFQAEDGAVRNFTLLTSGPRPDGGAYGGTVWAYGNYSNGNFQNKDVELTLTPDGPLLDGSAGTVLKRFLDGSTVRDVPIGRYTVTARYAAQGEAPQEMLVMRQDETIFAPSTTLMFRKEPGYGVMADFNLKLASKP
ncbi:carboxypeptidase regulatory-like domain-containing protein [Deinococcus hohokamensis]|uniref:Carboxypeptidase regulatory-like domain-containing protein n=1 Tax=Deinococcus hohokamensis TaxID=309883 RepID=A0ABV9I8R7_9DEIO